MTSGPPGVTFLEHTADVGVDVEAPSAELLFHRAAAGMMALLRGEEEHPESGARAAADSLRVETRTVEVSDRDRAALLRAWLRELLLLHETRNADYAGAAFLELTERRLEARIRTTPAAGAVREIKGVTYHELQVQETDEGWKARVIFDV